MLLKTSLLLPHLFCNAEFEVTEQSSEILILKIEMLLECQSEMYIEIFRF